MNYYKILDGIEKEKPMFTLLENEKMIFYV